MIRHLLNSSLEIWGYTETSDGMGGTTRTPVQRGTAPAKVDQPSETEQVVSAQARSNHTHSVYFAPGTDVRRGDELRTTDQVFRVISVLSPSHPVYVKAACELLQTEG